MEDLASRLDRSQDTSSTTQTELSTSALLEINDLKSKVTRLTEQNTKLEGDVSYLSSLSDQVNALWKCLPPGTGEEGQERVVTAVEVQDEMDEFRNDVYRKIKELATGLNNLRESVQLIERDKDESWEAVSHRVSTLVENSVGSLTERLTELEHTVQSQGTTPVRGRCSEHGNLVNFGTGDLGRTQQGEGASSRSSEHIHSVWGTS